MNRGFVKKKKQHKFKIIRVIITIFSSGLMFIFWIFSY